MRTMSPVKLPSARTAAPRRAAAGVTVDEDHLRAGAGALRPPTSRARVALTPAATTAHPGPRRAGSPAGSGR